MTVKMSKKMKELAMMSRIAAGDKVAMRELYETHAGALGNFIKNWLYDPSQAHDLIHETMMDVWRNAARFEGRSSLKSWIFSIARNKSIDLNRRNSRLSYTDNLPEIEDDHIGQEDYVFGVQNAKRLKQALSKLSNSHMRVLHLAFFEDMKYEDIAEVEGCPVGTIKTRIMHAKKKLLYIMQKDE